MFVKSNLSNKIDLNLTEYFSEILSSLTSGKIEQFLKEAQACKTNKEVLLNKGNIVEQSLNVLIFRTNHHLKTKLLWDFRILGKEIWWEFLNNSISMLLRILHSFKVVTNLFLYFWWVMHNRTLWFFLLLIVFNICFGQFFKVSLSLFVDVNKLTKLLIFEKINPSDNSIKEILQHSLTSLHNWGSVIKDLFRRKLKQLMHRADSWISIRVI